MSKQFDKSFYHWSTITQLYAFWILQEGAESIILLFTIVMLELLKESFDQKWKLSLFTYPCVVPNLYVVSGTHNKYFFNNYCTALAVKQKFIVTKGCQAPKGARLLVKNFWEYQSVLYTKLVYIIWITFLTAPGNYEKLFNGNCITIYSLKCSQIIRHEVNTT